MRVLITTNAATGHFLPMVPTARALIEAGHEVRVACPASFASSVERAGLVPMGCDEEVIDVPVTPAPSRDDRDARLA